MSPERETVHSAADAVIGRILYERFLIEREVDTGRFLTCIVKDLKNYCARVVLRSSDNLSNDLVPGALSYEQLCSGLIGINHPNVEEIIETGRLFDGRPYSISRFVKGDQLSDILKDGKRLTIEQSARIIEAVYEGLAAAHSRNILHCAVDPSNIIVSDLGGADEVIRIINFGTAWPEEVFTQQTAETVLADDPLYYAPPERLVKLGHRSPASDVYSLAALSYRMLAGKVPFQAAERDDQLQKISAGDIELPSELRTDLSGETERLILSGLTCESAWRPQKIDDFGSRLVLSLRRTSAPPRRRNGRAAQSEVIEIEIPQLEIVATTETLDEAIHEEAGSRLTRVHSRPRAAFSDRAITWSLIVLLLAGALSIPVGRMFMSEAAQVSGVGTMLSKVPENGQRRQIKYSFEKGEESDLGRRRSGLPSRRQLSLMSDAPGEIYVIEETSTDDLVIGFRFAHPRSPTVPVIAGKPVVTDVSNPIESPGLKAIWIVCSDDKNNEIESLRSVSDPNPLSIEVTRKLKHFLERNRDLGVDVDNNDAAGLITLTGNGERLVHRIPVKSDSGLTAQR